MLAGLDAIVAAADGGMVARGDVGAETDLADTFCWVTEALGVILGGGLIGLVRIEVRQNRVLLSLLEHTQPTLTLTRRLVQGSQKAGSAS